MGGKNKQKKIYANQAKMGGGGGEEVTCKKNEKKKTKYHHEIPSIITFTQRTEKLTEEKKDFQS
jgi:hypothetical protein